MKELGIVRKIDSLGRIVIPMELRRVFGIEEGDPLEVLIDGENIIFRKFGEMCAITGERKDLVQLKNGKFVSRKIAKEIAEELNNKV